MNGFRATAWRTYARTWIRESLGLQRLRRETKKCVPQPGTKFLSYWNQIPPPNGAGGFVPTPPPPAVNPPLMQLKGHIQPIDRLTDVCVFMRDYCLTIRNNWSSAIQIKNMNTLFVSKMIDLFYHQIKIICLFLSIRLPSTSIFFKLISFICRF